MHQLRFTAFYKVGRPAAASYKLLQFLMLDASQNGWVADLIAIEVEDWQHSSISNGIEKFIGLPGSGQRAGFRFAITDDTGNNQTGIIEGGPKSMTKRISQLTTFMNRPRCCWCNMAGDPAGE